MEIFFKKLAKKHIFRIISKMEIEAGASENS